MLLCRIAHGVMLTPEPAATQTISAVASHATACEFTVMTDPSIRPVRPDDATAIAAIYAHHVLHGTATFDIDPPDVASWREKIAAIAARGWPFLVAERDGAVAGYAYATQFRDRPAYATLAGWGLAMDANRQPDPSIEGETRAMTDALGRAAWQPHDVGYVNPHGTGSVIGARLRSPCWAGSR